MFFLFAIKRVINGDVFTSRLTVLTVSMTFKISILGKRLENTQKFTFDFVAFLFSLSVYFGLQVLHKFIIVMTK